MRWHGSGRTVVKIMTCDSSSGMALCQAPKVLPRYLMSSLGSFGCGWHSVMASKSVCAARGASGHRLGL